MQCETFRAITVPGSKGLRIADCGLRVAGCGLMQFSILFNVRVKQAPQSAIRNPQSALWPPACVRVKTDATRRQYGYCKTETGRQEEHQEGAGGVARHV